MHRLLINLQKELENSVTGLADLILPIDFDGGVTDVTNNWDNL